MKKFLSILLIVVTFSSCVSMTDRKMTEQEMANANITGKVSTTFTTFRFLHFIGDKSIKSKAQKELLKKAQEKYGENIEIRNIVIKGSGSLWNLTYSLGTGAIVSGIVYLTLKDGIAALWGGGEMALEMFLFGHFQKITATGDVILFGTDQGVIHKNQQGLEGAISKAIETLTKSLPQNSNIAILNMEASDISTAKYAVDELEFQLVNSKKFIVVDRLRIDQIRNEQKFQLSGDVDDNSAVSIGKILGANIVITGSISGSGNSKRLFLRVLNVQTSQIIAMVREDF